MKGLQDRAHNGEMLTLTKRGQPKCDWQANVTMVQPSGRQDTAMIRKINKLNK